MKTWIYIIGFTILIIGSSFLVYKVTKDYVPATAMATAISSAVLAIVTFLNLRHLRETENREIKENIYSVIHRQLKTFLLPQNHTIPFDGNDRNLSISWEWDVLKNQQFHLAYRIPKRVFNKLEEFTKNFMQYLNSFGLCIQEIFDEMLSRVKKKNPHLDKIFLVQFWVKQDEKSQFRFDMSKNLFLSENIRESLQQCKLTNKAHGGLRCEFISNAWKTEYLIDNENEVIEFFEELFQHIKEKSENYKNLVTSRESAKDLAHQILKSISPS